LLVYWLLFALFSAGVMMSRDDGQQAGEQRQPLLAMAALVVAVLIGFRYQVGADWTSYEFMFSFARHASLARMLKIGDPAYQFLNWSAQALDLRIWAVNLVCGAIFAWGLWRFARAQAYPWLAMLVAVPYLIIVVAMGYSRQAVAIGIIMAGLAAWLRGASLLRFAAYVAVAALFHRTAICVLPLVMLSTGRNRLFNLFAGTVAFALLYNVFLADSVEVFVKNYVKAGYSSQGAAIRVGMCVAPALLFLGLRRDFGFADQEERLWLYYSFAALLTLVVLIFGASSTAVDRIALYILPLQIVIFARLPMVTRNRGFANALVIVGAFAVQFVWLNFAVHARFWLPYQFYPMW
jgi:hypothetical protein